MGEYFVCLECFNKETVAKRQILALNKVADAAVSYIDQLCSYNDVAHPEVHKRRLELSGAVQELHDSGWVKDRSAK